MAAVGSWFGRALLWSTASCSGHLCAATLHTWYVNVNPGQIQPEAFLSVRASMDITRLAENGPVYHFPR